MGIDDRSVVAAGPKPPPTPCPKCGTPVPADRSGCPACYHPVNT